MSKSLMWLLIGLGATIGGLVPAWLGASYFSFWGILGSVVGAIAGLYFFNRLEG